MKQEKLVKLLFELIKNSKRSDRDLAKMLDISQPTVTRLRKVLEKEAIQQYTIIPNLAYLGFDLVALTFSRSKELVQPLLEQGKKWSKEHPNLVFVSTGQGLNADLLMISVHKDYADFVKFYQEFRTDWGKYLEDFKIFLISLSGSFIVKQFSFNYLIDAYKKSNK
ncbi:winged helix-turn-helix transcriptional regulator [Candidatus Bathyarchaeota archaeon]|nr:winged helix-turn-helix transcriptional regulator [Candidatus Bathyarchaeota archaeon]